MTGVDDSREPTTDLGSAAEAEPLAGIKVLVVDDEEDIRTFILTVLADAGARICEAEDGAEALKVAREESPDLITLDLSMAGVDGVEAFKRLRTDPELSSIPICIVTGHPEFRQVIYEQPAAPPEGYMDKPVDADKLVATVRRIIGLRQKRARRSQESA